MSSEGNTNKKTNRWLLVPIILMISVIPLIVMMKTFDTHMTDFAWVSEAETQGVDFFNYYKMIGIIILSAIMAAVIVVTIAVRRPVIRFTQALIPLAVYAAFVILSALLSNYSYFVLHGIREQFESVWVLLSYAIISYYTFLFVREEKDIDLVIRLLMISAGVIAILGTFQWLNGFTDVNLDFFRTTFGKKMITPSSYWDNVDSLEFTFAPGRVYVTLYNANYVGMYVALLLPAIISLLLIKKTAKSRIIYSLLGVGLVICLIGSEAKNGVISIVAAFFLMMLLYRKTLFKKPIVLVISCGVTVGIFVVGNIALNGALVNGIKGIFSYDVKQHALTSIQGTDQDVSIVYNGNELHSQLVVTEDGGVYIYCQDADGNPVETVQNEEGLLVTTDERYEGVGLFYTTVDVSETQQLPILGLHISNDDDQDDISDYWYFCNQVDGSGHYYMYNMNGKFVDVVMAESALFTDNPNLFSGRGFIWAKTIPLLKDYILFGSGPDTFEIAFPQGDYLAMRQNGYGTAVITKPHNMYLQIGVNTGVVSLIAFIAFFLVYAVDAIRLLWRRKPETYTEHMNAGILSGTFGYMVSGIINDSTITMAPIFWCLMGVGLSLNFLLRKQLKKEEKKSDTESEIKAAEKK